MIVLQCVGEVSLKSSPVHLYRAITTDPSSSTSSYLLESREGIPRVARFSIIGFDPAIEISVKSSHLSVRCHDNALSSLELKRWFNPKKPLSVLRAFIEHLNIFMFETQKSTAERSIAPKDAFSAESSMTSSAAFSALADCGFSGGFVGYIAYDFVRYSVCLDGSTVDDLKHPDFAFTLARKNIIYDHKERKTYLLTNTFVHDDELKDAIDAAYDEITQMKDALKDIDVGDDVSGDEYLNDYNGNICARGDCVRSFTANMSEEEFKRCVRKAKEYIRAGDIFQVVLSQRLEAERSDDELSFYTRLSELNPSPYMYFLDFGTHKIVGASPEMLVRVDSAFFPTRTSPRTSPKTPTQTAMTAARIAQITQTSQTAVKTQRLRKVKSCPIAGTRPRGKDEFEDKMLEFEMLNDEKERAEHLMLVDLARNDIGKVSKFGTVSVPRFMYVEKFSHVQHIVSDVEGVMRDDADEFDALEATFPAGTVSGAPKVRAMEIIEELEPTRRGIYAGCVGYFSFNRAADTAITIRTAVFEREKVYVQAGAGIVADSVPEREYRETLNKCAALLACLNPFERF